MRGSDSMGPLAQRFILTLNLWEAWGLQNKHSIKAIGFQDFCDEAEDESTPMSPGIGALWVVASPRCSGLSAHILGTARRYVSLLCAMPCMERALHEKPVGPRGTLCCASGGNMTGRSRSDAASDQAVWGETLNPKP